MPFSRAQVLALTLVVSACVGPIKEYSDDASDDPAGDGDGDPTTETDEATGDGDGDSGDGDGDPGDGDGESGDGDGDPGDGDGDCPLGSPGCPCDATTCDPGYECMGGLCQLSSYPWGECGWDSRNEWYECGFEGESTDPNFPIDCGDLPVVSGAPCPDGFGVEGCCKVGGDLFWCKEGFVERKVCGG